MKSLDEAQDLTSEQLASWLLRHGWEKQPQYAFQLGGPSVLTGYQFQKQGNMIATGSLLQDVVTQIAEIEQRDLQSLLREINPRMRKGMPSQAARAAHAGPWVGHMGGEFPLVTIGHWGDDGSFTAGLMLWDARKVAEAAEAKYQCAFWPCDEHGAKVRWPEENGAML